MRTVFPALGTGVHGPPPPGYARTAQGSWAFVSQCQRRSTDWATGLIASAKDADDAKAAKICRDIAEAYQERLTYPGEIKVVVIRESRFTELAR